MDKKPIALEDRPETEDGRLSSPSVGRNKDVILETFRAHAPNEGRVLEIASGTGEHALHISSALPGLIWRPSDPDAGSRASIASWRKAAKAANLLDPLTIDTTQTLWGVEEDAPFDVMVCINMIHIAPWEAGLGLIAGAGRLLRPDGVLFLYGPFKRGGVHTAPSNAAFDDSLRSRDPAWGVRDLDTVENEAQAQNLVLKAVIEMPANNLSVVFHRR